MRHTMGEAVDRSVTDAGCHGARLPRIPVGITPNLITGSTSRGCDLPAACCDVASPPVVVA